jgi:dienelactone hydrolase
MLTERPVAFPSEGATLRGLLITATAQAKRLPLVVMAHRTSATIQMVAIEYARVFANAGLAVLIYDHRNLGRSDGSPRLEKPLAAVPRVSRCAGLRLRS